MLTKHANATGIRVNVLKPALRARTGGKRKTDWTSVYVRGRDLDELLPMADGNVGAVSDAVRKSAEAVTKPKAHGFSAACVSGARKVLAKAQAETLVAAAKVAADNNAAWG